MTKSMIRKDLKASHSRSTLRQRQTGNKQGKEQNNFRVTAKRLKSLKNETSQISKRLR